jgi:hypothetical protein
MDELPFNLYVVCEVELSDCGSLCVPVCSQAARVLCCSADRLAYGKCLWCTADPDAMSLCGEHHQRSVA